MKKFIPFLSIAVAVAACTTNPESITKSASGSAIEVQSPAINPDTIGLSDYQLWKAQNELTEEREINNRTDYTAVAPVKKKVYRAPVQKAQQVEYNYPKSTSTGRTSTKRQDSESNEGTGATTGEGNGNDGIAQGTGTAEAEEEKKKEGMSKAAKGAIIGGAGGAATGAVINKKNRAAGAVIGAVIGAGGGYVVGRKMDKKDGRN